MLIFVNICILEYDEVIFVEDKGLTKRSLNVTPARKPTVSEAKLKINIFKGNPIFLEIKKSLTTEQCPSKLWKGLTENRFWNALIVEVDGEQAEIWFRWLNLIMTLFDGRGVAYSYESTVPAPLLPSIDQSYNPPRSYKAPPMVDARSVRVSTHCSEEQPHAHPPQPVRVDGHPGAHPPGAVHRPGRHPHPLTHHRSGQERIQPVERHRQHGGLLEHCVS